MTARTPGPPSKMIDASVLSRGHALSLNEQPYLKDLFETFLKTGDPITMVIGAGVSMNAGLPSWGRLLENMTQSIRDTDIRAFASSDTTHDMLRKAEVVEQLVRHFRDHRKTTEIVRDALYEGVTKPGELADALARVIACSPERFRIITTNFDELLEEALDRYVASDSIKAFGLEQVSEWQEFNDAGQVGVLHVHGLLRTGNEDSIEPLVLTETQFLKHGPAVKDVLLEEIDRAHVVFVGVSMTDPNLVGPLWERQPKKGKATSAAPRYSRAALLVPSDRTVEQDTVKYYKYVVAKATYLEQDLGLSPIFFKSYSQLVQAVSEMALALHLPDLYKDRPRGGERSLRYGKRFDFILNRAYSTLGCNRNQSAPVGRAAEEAAAKLQFAVKTRSPLKATLDGIRAACAADGLDVSEDECFELAIWLRCRRATGGPSAPYAVNLVSTSHQVYRNTDLMPDPEAVVPGSASPISEALFQGMTQYRNLDPRAGHGKFKGVVAAPIVVKGSCSDESLSGDGPDLERLTLGVVALYSTHFVDREDGADGAVSMLAYAETVDRLVDLSQSLYETAAAIILKP